MNDKTQNVTLDSLTLDGRTVNGKIKKVATAGKQFIYAVHDAGCNVCGIILHEIEQDNMPNVDRVRATLLNMPKGTRRQAMAEWFKMVLPISIVFNADNSDIKVTMLKGKAAKNFEGQSLEWACANVFEDVIEPERNPKPFDYRKALENIMKNLRKGVEGKKEMKGDAEQAERILHGLEAVTADVFEA